MLKNRRTMTMFLASAALAPLALATTAMGAGVAMPPGSHLVDGDYVSDPDTFEWGTLQLKLSVKGGVITDVQALQMPAHRERSVEISEMAKPILLREAIQNQTASVHLVSSATLTTDSFRRAMANALAKATAH